jgi:hypothetical protein
MSSVTIHQPSAVYQASLDRVICFVNGVTTSDEPSLYDKFWDGQKWLWQDHDPPPGTSPHTHFLPSISPRWTGSCALS